MLLEIGLAHAAGNYSPRGAAVQQDAYRISRLPKQIQNQLIQQSHASIPSSRYSRHKILTTPQQNTITPKPNSQQQGNRFNERRDQYRYRLRRTPDRQSVDKQSQPSTRQSNYREMTLMDITRPLTDGQTKTIDDHYRASPSKTTDYELLRNPLYLLKQTQTQSAPPETSLVIVKSQQMPSEPERTTTNPCSKLTDSKTSLTKQTTTTAISKRWRSTGQQPQHQNKTSAFRLLLSNDTSDMVQKLDKTYELTADKCKFQLLERPVPAKPSSHRPDPNHVTQEPKQRNISTVPLLGKRNKTTPPPSSTAKNLTSTNPIRNNRMPRRAASLRKAITPDDECLFNTPAEQFYEEIEDILRRKPVIPSLTQLTDVMNSSHNYKSPDLTQQTTDRRVFQSPEYKNHLIQKYHGDQIVVDSTNYDEFARK